MGSLRKPKTCLVIGVVLLPLSTSLFAQNPPKTPPEASGGVTKIESFNPPPGTMWTRGWSFISTLHGMVVEAMELRDLKGKTVRGVKVEIKDRDVAFIDEDELPSLIEGIESLMKIQANPTKFENFEAIYLTKDGLRIVAFDDSKDQISFAVRIDNGKADIVVLDLLLLKNFQSMFSRAKDHLVSIR